MPFFRKTASDEELKWISLQTGMLCKAFELENLRVPTDVEVYQRLIKVCKEFEVKVSREQRKTAKAAVLALLYEGQFIGRMVQMNLDGREIGLEAISEMMGVVEGAVAGFLKSQ